MTSLIKTVYFYVADKKNEIYLTPKRLHLTIHSKGSVCQHTRSAILKIFTYIRTLRETCVFEGVFV